MTTSRYVADGTIIALALSVIFWAGVALRERQQLRGVRADYAVAERMLSTRIVLEVVDVGGPDTLVDIDGLGAYWIAKYGGGPGHPLNTIWLGDHGPGVRLIFREPA